MVLNSLILPGMGAAGNGGVNCSSPDSGLSALGQRCRLKTAYKRRITLVCNLQVAPVSETRKHWRSWIDPRNHGPNQSDASCLGCIPTSMMLSSACLSIFQLPVWINNSRYTNALFFSVT